MPEKYLETRREFLRRTQNSDGGWGYFPGKRSWLEPTAYAMLALNSEAGSANWRRAWDLARSWQLSDGAWKPTANVDDPHWSTALMVSLHCVRGVYDSAFQRGVEWLLDQSGAESSPISRIVSLFRGSATGHDLKYKGWPWRPDSTAWIEPTAHSLVALKKAAPKVQGNLLTQRVVLGEGMILLRRCKDGGWNYGSKAALGIDLPSYPETTALALLGLQGSRGAELRDALDQASRLLEQSTSPLAKAWLAISLRNYGMQLKAPEETGVLKDIAVAALECLAHPRGDFHLLRPTPAV